MVKTLRHQYLVMLAPAAVGFLLLTVCRLADKAPAMRLQTPKWMGTVLFSAAVAAAVALPVLIRAHFAHQTGNLTAVEPRQMLRFQQRLMATALTAPYLSLSACMLGVERFVSAGALLAGLYAAYYFYPSRRRIDFDCRIFRVST